MHKLFKISILLFTIFFASCSLLNTGSQSTFPTNVTGSSSDDSGNAIAIDSQGNIYVGGTTQGDLSGETSNGGYDGFIAKYSSLGSLIWTRLIGTSSDESINDIAVDINGNILVCGYTEGALDGNSTSGGKDIFVAKFASNGTKTFTKQRGTSSFDSATSLVTDASANVFLAGSTQGALDGNSNSGGEDAFLMKFNSIGDWQWTTQRGSTSTDTINDLAIDSGLNLYLGGFTLGSFDSFPSSGLSDFLVLKFNSSGIWQRTRQIGSSDADLVNSINVDINGNIYLTGSSKANFDGGSNQGDADIQIVKYDSDFTKLFSLQAGTVSLDSIEGSAVDKNGNIYFTGYTEGDMENTSTGASDIFVSKYTSGTISFLKQVGTAQVDQAFDIAIDAVNNIYITGRTAGDLDGAINNGGYDYFILKFDSSGNLL